MFQTRIVDKKSQATLWAHPLSSPTGTRALSSWVNQSGHEADDLPSSSVDFKSACSYTSAPPYVLGGVVHT